MFKTYNVVLYGRVNMTKPEWGTRHTRIARRLEEHLKAEKPKVYPSYSKYMKVLHAKTS